MIRTVMNRPDWATLLALAVIWGGAFLFIGVAVRHVAAADLCLAAADDRRRGDVGCSSLARREGRACRVRSGARCCCSRCSTMHALHPVRLGPDAYRQRPRLDPQCDDADLGRDRRPCLHQRRAPDPAQARRSPARLRRRRADDRPGLLATSARCACPARLRHGRSAAMRSPAVWARRFKQHGPVADVGHDRPADRRRADDAAGGAAARPAVDAGLAAARGHGARSSLWRCCAPPSPTSSISG